MKKKDVSLLLNIILILLEIVGFIVSINKSHNLYLEYYTEESNLLALIVTTIFVIYSFKDKKIPKWLSELKFISNINLAITFVVVLLVLIPLGNFDFYTYLISGTMKYHHLMCPIISLVSFIFFDELGKYSKKDIYIGLSLTFMYGIVMIILNIIGEIVGPYPFLRIKEQTFYVSIIWFILMFGLSYLIALFLKKLYTKYNH